MLYKTDLASAEAVTAVEHRVAVLKPHARLQRASFGRVPRFLPRGHPASVIATPTRHERAAAWRGDPSVVV